MALVKRTNERQHRLTIRTDGGDGQVIIVRGGAHGKRAYLWAGRDQDGVCVTVSGRATLLRLAKEIIAEFKR